MVLRPESVEGTVELLDGMGHTMVVMTCHKHKTILDEFLRNGNA